MNTVPRNLNYRWGEMFNFLILSSVWNIRFRVISDHTDYPRELKLIGTQRIMGYHNVSWLSISVKPKNMQGTTLVLRVCVYMTARSWSNVWHITLTKYTQINDNDVYTNECFTMWWLFEHFHISFVRNIIRQHFNCDYTQPVWEQISNTNQFIQNEQRWVYSSNIPPTCVFWNPDDAHRSRSAQCWQITFARRYFSQQPTGERKRIVPTCVQVCVRTLWRATANLYMLSGGYRPPLLEKLPSITVGGLSLQIATRSDRRLPNTSPCETPLNHNYSRLFDCCWNKILVGIYISIYIYIYIYTSHI